MVDHILHIFCGKAKIQNSDAPVDFLIHPVIIQHVSILVEVLNENIIKIKALYPHTVNPLSPNHQFHSIPLKLTFFQINFDNLNF